MDFLLLSLAILAAWDVAKSSVKHTKADYARSRDASVKKAEKAAGKSSLPSPQRRAVVRRHRAGYVAGEILHGFPVTRTGVHAGWLAHKTASAHAKAVREEARTTNAETQASFLGALRDHRARQAQAQAEIDKAITQAPEPVRGKKAVQEAVGGNVVPFPRREPDAAPPLPADGVVATNASPEAAEFIRSGRRLFGDEHPEPGPYAPKPRDSAWLKPGEPRCEGCGGTGEGSAPLGTCPACNGWGSAPPPAGSPELPEGTICQACGNPGTAADPVLDTPGGSRIHRSHADEHRERYDTAMARMREVPEVKPGPEAGDWPTGVPHRRKADDDTSASPATNGTTQGGTMSGDTTYTSVLADAKAAHAQADEDTTTIRGRMDAAYQAADEMTAANVDPAVIDAQMSYADSLKSAVDALTAAGEHAGSTATTAERFHGQMDEAVKDSPGTVAERQFHEGS